MAKKTTKPSSNATETKTPVLSQNEVVQEEKLATDSKSSETPKLDFCQILTKPNVESQQEQVQNGLSGFPQAKPSRAAETIMKKRGRKSKPINTTERSKTKKEKINSPSRRPASRKTRPVFWRNQKCQKRKCNLRRQNRPRTSLSLLASRSRGRLLRSSPCAAAASESRTTLKKLRRGKKSKNSSRGNWTRSG